MGEVAVLEDKSSPYHKPISIYLASQKALPAGEWRVALCYGEATDNARINAKMAAALIATE